METAETKSNENSELEEVMKELDIEFEKFVNELAIKFAELEEEDFEIEKLSGKLSFKILKIIYIYNIQ